jgi:Uri superfamily endonuclease
MKETSYLKRGTCPSASPIRSTINPCPRRPRGSILLLACSSTRTIGIGRLGTIRLRPGHYVYVVSAVGPGGLQARIGHHRRKAARPHWHIDYLRRYASLQSSVYASGVRCEHEWAAKVAAIPGAAMVLRGPAVPICDGETHLYWSEESSVTGVEAGSRSDVGCVLRRPVNV